MRKSRAGQLVTLWLEENDVSQEQLAARVTEVIRRRNPSAKPVNQSTISSWCLGRYIPGGEMMVALQEITGASISLWMEPPEPEKGSRGSVRHVARAGRQPVPRAAPPDSGHELAAHAAPRRRKASGE